MHDAPPSTIHTPLQGTGPASYGIQDAAPVPIAALGVTAGRSSQRYDPRRRVRTGELDHEPHALTRPRAARDAPRQGVRHDVVDDVHAEARTAGSAAGSEE